MGAAAEFLVSGTFAESAGLNVPAAAAQDAVYQLNGKTVVTDSNEVNLDDYRITVQLKAAGTALVQVGTDSSKAADHLEKMTAAYNHALHFYKATVKWGPVYECRHRICGVFWCRNSLCSGWESPWQKTDFAR